MVLIGSTGGSLSITSDLNVGGTGTFSGNVVLGATGTNTKVNGDSTFSGSVVMGGTATLSSNLLVGGTSNFSGRVAIGATASLTNDLLVAGKLGIGTTNPTNIVQVGTGSKFRIANTNSDYSQIGTDNQEDTVNTRIVINGYNNSSRPGRIEYRSTANGTIMAHRFLSNVINRFIIWGNGFVSVGNIESFTNRSYMEISGSFNATENFGGGGASYNYSLWLSHGIRASSNSLVTGSIIANSHPTYSDIRIKKNIQVIDDNISLHKLRRIEPKSYLYVDNRTNDKSVFGFIAQDVKKEFPEAVDLLYLSIPNHYKLCDYEILDENHYKIFTDVSGLILNQNKIVCLDKTGAQVDLIIEDITSDFIIVKLITKLELNDKIQLYGTYVDDFHTLNKDYLFTINFSATQELDRMLEWHTKEVDRSVCGDASTVYGPSLLTQIKQLQIENQSLKSQIQDLQNENIQTKSKLLELETKLNQLLSN